MKPLKTAGFTLIELLTVIAIIAIMAAMGMTVGPKIIERSKWTHFKTTCNQIKNACALYATKDAVKSKTTFPPAYGYRAPRKQTDIPENENQYFIFKPFMAYIDHFGDEGWYDRFQSASYDTDHDGVISLLEFSPMGSKQEGGGYLFATAQEQPLYDGTNLPNEISRMMSAHRPYVYIPVNSVQAQKATKYWKDRVAQIGGRELEGAYAVHWNPGESFASLPQGKKDNPISGLLPGRFPPQIYDDFVLITPGPAGSTGGILAAPDTFMNDLASYTLSEKYHILALRAFFLATRDMDVNQDEPAPNFKGNGKFDFDYRNRTRGTDGKTASYAIPEFQRLPDGTAGAGPGIYECNFPDGA